VPGTGQRQIALVPTSRDLVRSVRWPARRCGCSSPYRRDDSISITGRINDVLAERFGRENVFFDVDTIPFGVDFRRYISNTVAACDVVLVIIGPRWLDIADNTGIRRLDLPQDFVRIEVEAALQRDIPVVPVLVSGAVIPSEDALPPSLKELARRNGIVIRYDPDFHPDVQRLIRGIPHAAGGTGEPTEPTLSAVQGRTTNAASSARGSASADPVAAIRFVAAAVRPDMKNAALTGILFTRSEQGTLALVGTDSYRLAYCALGLPALAEDNVLVSARALAATLASARPGQELRIAAVDGGVQVNLGTSKVRLPRISGDYVNWRPFIRQGSRIRATFDHEELAQCVGEAKRLLADRILPLRLRLEGDHTATAIVTAEDLGTIEMSVTVQSTGVPIDGLDILVNAGYLLDGLAGLGDTIEANIDDAIKPIDLRSPGDSCVIYILMPVRPAA
jgi:DNA polymerase III beta subunit, central domain/TIR domain/DNA polymerase III beta subunit, C-terminal domain